MALRSKATSPVLSRAMLSMLSSGMPGRSPVPTLVRRLPHTEIGGLLGKLHMFACEPYTGPSELARSSLHMYVVRT